MKSHRGLADHNAHQGVPQLVFGYGESGCYIGPLQPRVTIGPEDGHACSGMLQAKLNGPSNGSLMTNDPALTAPDHCNRTASHHWTGAKYNKFDILCCLAALS